MVHSHTPNGYVALMSALIVSVVLVVLSVSISTAGLYARFDAADAEYKQRSSYLAESCIAAALVNIDQNAAYVPTAGGETLFVGDDTCTLVSVITSGGQVIIESKGTFRDAVTNLKVVVMSGSLHLVSWEELSTL